LESLDLTLDAGAAEISTAVSPGGLDFLNLGLDAKSLSLQLQQPPTLPSSDSQKTFLLLARRIQQRDPVGTSLAVLRS